jgi:hypothetical protein
MKRFFAMAVLLLSTKGFAQDAAQMKARLAKAQEYAAKGFHAVDCFAGQVFALCASIVFGITQRNTTRDMLRYGAYCFAMFIGGVIIASWAMWIIKH